MSNSAINYPSLFNEPLRLTPREMDRLLVFCTEQQASDITLQTNETIRAEIHGRLHAISQRPLTHHEVCELINSIYGANATTQILSGQDVDTHYEVRPERGLRYRYRVNASGCQTVGHAGIQITLRSIPTYPPALSSMQLPADIIEAIAPEDGVVYVTGATGSGKSTLLAAIIKTLAEQPESHRKILTYEAPIEFVYDELIMPNAIISQAEIPRHLPSFASGVRNALRRKPHLILVGEARDNETIAAVLEAALTGHPVYTTLHANGVAETVRRLVGSFASEERAGRSIDIIETLRLIIWQKLVPTVDGKRLALREYLVFNEEVRDQMLGIDPDHITQRTRELLQTHGRPMRYDVEEKFAEKRISQRHYRLLMQGIQRQAKQAAS